MHLHQIPMPQVFDSGNNSRCQRPANKGQLVDCPRARLKQSLRIELDLLKISGHFNQLHIALRKLA